MDARKTAWDRLMTYRFEDADSDRLSIETIDALTYARDMLATQQSRLEALEKEQSAWRKFTDEANRTLEAADKKIATLQARIEALEAELAALREAAAKAKWLLDDATYHDGRYGQQSAPDWQKRACKVSDDLAALLQEGE